MTRQVINGVSHCKYGHAIEGDNRREYVINGEKRIDCAECKRRHAREITRRNNKNILPPDTASTMLNYKEPLTVVENGFGHYGTLVVDEATQQFTQCHICGLFVKHLGHHVRSHNMSARDYRIQFSLPLQMPLRSAQAKSTTFGRWAKLTDEEKKAEIARLTAASRKRVEDGKTGIRKTREMLYKKNLNGNCPDQLLDKIMKLAETLGRTPSLREFRREYDGEGTFFANSIYNTFGGYLEALRILGMTQKSSGHAPVYTKQSLMQILQDFKQLNGREAVGTDAVRGLPSMTTFVNHFGSWSHAKEMAYGPTKQLNKE